MSFDQGTTSSRCILFERDGRIASMVQREFAQIFPADGWVEHDPEDIWRSVKAATAEAMKKASAHPSDIIAIGITNISVQGSAITSVTANTITNILCLTKRHNSFKNISKIKIYRYKYRQKSR